MHMDASKLSIQKMSIPQPTRIISSPYQAAFNGPGKGNRGNCALSSYIESNLVGVTILGQAMIYNDELLPNKSETEAFTP